MILRIDFADAGKAALVATACIGSVIGLTELLAWLEIKYKEWKERKRDK